MVNGHFMNLNWRYLPYIRILEFPLIIVLAGLTIGFMVDIMFRIWEMGL